MSPGLQAHLRLLEKLRDRTRTHEYKERHPVRGRHFTAEEKRRLREKLLRLDAAGFNRREMCRECNTTNKTIQALIGFSTRPSRWTKKTR